MGLNKGHIGSDEGLKSGLGTGGGISPAIPSSGDWILETGLWNDLGIWVDTDVWID